MMKGNVIKNDFLEARKTLDAFLSNEKNIKKIERAGNILVYAFKKGNKVISCGNGGSMCDAMHFAEELSGRFRNARKPFAAIAVSDPSHISCTANDYGYEDVFARFVGAVGKQGDVLLAISTSGNSPNIIKAVKAAKKKNMKVIGLTGKNGGRMASYCNVELRAPYSKYSDRAQEIHIKIIHSLIHYVENVLF